MEVTKMQSNKHYKDEATLTRKVREYLNKLDGVKATKISDRFQKGISDFIACVNGKFVAIELKRDKGTPSPHQLLFIKEIKQAGGYGGVCYSLRDVEKLIEEARNDS